MADRDTIMVVGIGELGSIVLEDLARVAGICPIVAAGRNADWGFRKTNSAIESASYHELYPAIRFQPLDLLQTEQAAEVLARVAPTIIYNSTSLQSWWVVNELPAELNARIYRDFCGLGPWAAMHLALAHRLMQAVRLAGIHACVINASFPDAVNASLSRVDLAPATGIGNIDLAVPYIRKATAELLRVPMRDVTVELVGHHYHAYHWCRHGRGHLAPHHLRVYVGHDDVTSLLGDEEALIAQLPARGMRPAGRHGQVLVAASSLKVILAVLRDTGERTHVPGPRGLEGGYPVRVSRQGVELLLPAGMSPAQARQLNLEAQRYDGVEEIGERGDIRVTDEAYETFRELLGVDCRAITIQDAHAQAVELKAKFHEFARRHGVDV